MPSVPRICFQCGKWKYKFRSEKGYRWLCPDPKHDARVRAMKRRGGKKNARKGKDKEVARKARDRKYKK
jgi:hypothetical protein